MAFLFIEVCTFLDHAMTLWIVDKPSDLAVFFWHCLSKGRRRGHHVTDRCGQKSPCGLPHHLREGHLCCWWRRRQFCPLTVSTTVGVALWPPGDGERPEPPLAPLTQPSWGGSSGQSCLVGVEVHASYLASGMVPWWGWWVPLLQSCEGGRQAPSLPLLAEVEVGLHFPCMW